MRLEYLTLAAVGLDLIAGDPRWLPHPVRGIGALAALVEKAARKIIRSEFIAGLAAVPLVLIPAGAVAFGIIAVARILHPAAGDVAAIMILYTTLAARDLTAHSGAVYKALKAGDLKLGREKVAMMVGRDTENLDEAEVSRAAIESVAENTVDGVTAPMFYALLAGPVGAIVYKAINTLDSTFGYKNERYMRFGRASAKLDDVANYIPARLTALLLPAAAALTGLNAKNAIIMIFRDGKKHPSPNSGLCEAGTAGALGIRLGGLNYYFGEASEKPALGDAGSAISAEHIRLANRLMYATYFLCLAAFIGLRVAIEKLITGGLYGN